MLSGWEVSYQKRIEQANPVDEILSHQEAAELSVTVQAGLEAGRQLVSSEPHEESQKLQLIEQLEKGKAARDTLVVGSLRLAAWFVRATMDFNKEDRIAKGKPGQKGSYIRDLSTLAGGELEYSDRMQLATIGLIRAAERWQPEKVRFSTAAMTSMEQELSLALFRQQSPYWIPPNKTREINIFANRRDELVGKLKRQPTPDELAEVIGIPPARAVALEQLLQARQKVSFEEVEALWLDQQEDRVADGDHETLAIGDVLTDAGVDKSVVDEVALEEVEYRVDELLDLLDDRQKQVLGMRFGFFGGEPLTLEEVGQEFGVTRERIRQIEAKALAKLRYLTRGQSGSLNLLDSEDPQMGTRSELRLDEGIEGALDLTKADPYALEGDRVTKEEKAEEPPETIEKNQRYHPGRPYSLTELREMSEPGWLGDD